MRKTKKGKHWWVWLLVGAYIFWIFHHSMMIAEASNSLSYAVTYKLMELLEHFGLSAEFRPFHHFVRKLAHFTEFAGLGFLVGLAMHVCPLFSSRFLNFTIFLLAIPFSDEMLQNFYEGRATQLKDMIIDGSGILFGGFVIYVLILIIKDLFSHHGN